MFPTVTIQLARTAAEFEAAFRLLRAARERWGLDGNAGATHDLWLLKHHALPATNTIVAVQAGRVVAAICLFGDSPFHLPLESRLELRTLRHSLEGRLAELSLPGIHPDCEGSNDLTRALYHYAHCFGTTYCHYDGFVTEAPLAWAKAQGEELRFRRIYEPVDDRQLLYLDCRSESVDYRAGIAKGFCAEYQFPEKKFFLVAHQSMQPSVLNHLFNVRTQLFASLNDADLRVLKNVYDWGEYAKLLPSRDLKLPAKKTPRFPRFPMNCEGTLVCGDGDRGHLQLLDVSREGMKIRAEHPPEPGASCVVTLYVGVNRKTELIGHVIWCDEETGIAGVDVRSSDDNWRQLIDYLEKDYLRVA